jgi:hypothetical protein
MLELNGFGLSVQGARPVPGHSDFAALAHGQEYAVVLRNNRGCRVDAKLKIDGVDMGTFRLKPWSSATIERPTGQARKFTFLKEGTARALRAGVPTGDQLNGLITVVFSPESERTWSVMNCSALECQSFQSYSSGGTALGASSSQSFSDTSALTDIDRSQVTTLNLRLVIDNNAQQPWLPEQSVRTISMLSNPVPPRMPSMAPMPQPFDLFG